MYRHALGLESNPTEECVDLKTMIQSATYNGAYAMFLEDITGSIEVGKSADMVVLDKDLFNIPAKDISKTNVMMTLFKGRIVYQASQPTVTDHQVVLYQSAPNYPGDSTPYGIVVSHGTTVKQLYDSLNAPVGGEINVTDLSGNAVADGATPITDDMQLISTSDDSSTIYSIVVDLPNMPNGFTVSNIAATGCEVAFTNPLPGLGVNDFYLLRDQNKASAVTLDVRDISGDGKTYWIEARDIDKGGGLMPSLNGSHSLYVYSPYCPLYLPYPDANFGESQGLKVAFP
jgi:hypothetical protein